MESLKSLGTVIPEGPSPRTTLARTTRQQSPSDGLQMQHCQQQSQQQ